MPNVRELSFRYVTILLIMFIDIISGVVKVKRTGVKYESAKMATGLYKKISTILCMVTADILAVMACEYMHMNFIIVKPVYIYIVFMESLSVYENCGQAQLKELFIKLVEGFKNGKDNKPSGN